MFKQYFKQVIYQLKENKLISWISILGTAFSITMIMVLILILQIKNADYRPEIHRNRTLYVLFRDIMFKSNNTRTGSNFSLQHDLVKECFYSLKSTEMVTAYSKGQEPVYSTEYSNFLPGQIKYTDTTFWKLFDFKFLYGKPFTEADFQSGIKKAVITENIARTLYHTENAIGKTLLIKGVAYNVCGVTEDFPELATHAYADVYVPYTAAGVNDGFTCLLLAHDRDDFTAIRQEIKANIERFNIKENETYSHLRDQPYTHFTQTLFHFNTDNTQTKETIIMYTILLLFFLLVPAINLSGLTHSHLEKKMEEIGIRRSFGASRQQIISLILNENLILTLLGGVIGLTLSYACLFLLRNWLLGSEQNISIEALSSPKIFLVTFFSCLLLNLLSAGIPAWKASNKEIVNILK